MKSVFSTHWNSSKQPRKQRKYRYNAPLHVRNTLLHSPLSKELRKTYNVRSARIRKGDTVRIMRGDFKKKEGKVNTIDLSNLKITVDGAERSKRDGSKVFYPIDPSNVMIIKAVSDNRRFTKGTLATPAAKEKKQQPSVQASPKEKKVSGAAPQKSASQTMKTK